MARAPHPTRVDHLPPSPERGARRAAHRPAAALVAGSALVLAALVAVAAGGSTVWSAPRRGAMDRLDLLLVMAALAVVVVPAAIGGSIAIRRRPGGGDGRLPLRASALRAAPVAAAALAVATLAAVTWMDAVLRPPPPGALPLPGAGFVPELMDMSDWFRSAVKAGESQVGDGVAGAPEPEGAFPVAILVVALALALVAGVVARLVGRRAERTDGHAGEDEDRATAHRAVMGTIDAMLADPDPRTAIIGAYARLLQGLEAVGSGRRPYEAPMEHVQRALAVLRVRPEPLRRLIALFQTARFSNHTLTASHRDDALDALHEVAADLGGRPAAVRASAAWRPVGRRS